MRKAEPAKGIKPTRSPSSRETKSRMASLARASRLGRMSLASMEREVSTAIRISIPLRRTSTHLVPYWGRARATKTLATARMTRVSLMRLRTSETLAVSRARRRGAANRCRACCRLRAEARRKNRRAAQAAMPMKSHRGWAKWSCMDMGFLCFEFLVAAQQGNRLREVVSSRPSRSRAASKGQANSSRY